MTRKLKGTVTSDRMQKTAVVRVDHLKKHGKYLKYVTVSKKYKVHDEANMCHIGDYVIIEETRPLSKEKRWKVAALLKRPLADKGLKAESKPSREAEVVIEETPVSPTPFIAPELSKMRENNFVSQS